jgi:hypothetical protein
MSKGRLTDEARLHRDQLERIIFELGPILPALDEVILRSKQAVRRTPIVAPVLEPAIFRLEEIRQRINNITLALGEIWTNGSERKWK